MIEGIIIGLKTALSFQNLMMVMIGCFAGIKILLPEKSIEEVNHNVLDYKKVIYLVIIMIFYGITILRVGFFLSTSIFLLLSYYFLGERRWILMLIFSFPFVALFMFLLHGALNIYLRDPLLKYLGIIGWLKEF